jgi:RimJ/RimL family protein N-acetyltransferase
MVESDRSRLVELFTDPEFMVFSARVDTVDEANRYVDHLLEVNQQLAFAKQPIVISESGEVVGYAGVDWFELDGEQQLEWGYRLVPAARGLGIATEASRALLAEAQRTFDGTIFAIIHPENAPSIAAIKKLGFEFWKTDALYGEERQLYRFGVTLAV